MILSLFVLGACSSLKSEHREVASERKTKKSSEDKDRLPQNFNYTSGQYR